jgi:formylglycine-generating enzyme required for sulfatase activity
MKAFYNTLIVLIFGLGSSLLWANNIQVSNIALVNQNTTAGLNNAANHTFVQFDMTWDNSWRNSAGPSNWDAAWVFVKFQVFGSPEWLHATLSATDANHTITNNNGVTMNIDATANGRGVMVHRTSNGNGTVNLQGVRLRWDYRSGNVVHDTANVTVRVFAIEMVYIPEGQFFIGDGTLTTPNPSTNAFRINNVGNNRPILISSEAAFNFINSSASTGTVPFGYNPRFTDAYTLPANFPKGFSAHYVMKYELSVQQYVDFFNCLRTDITTAKNNRNIQGSQPTRSTFAWNSSPLSDATAGIGANRPQCGFSMEDFYTYADWSGLRMMSELEYEKICRGTDRTGISPGIAVYPVNGEYAWGESGNLVSFSTAGTLVNDGTISEGIVNPTTATQNIGVIATGPVRCGIFAAKNPSTNQRRLTGSSYYGVMELTGNVEEWVMPACPQYQGGSCSSTIYNYTGTHGDGNIDQSTGRFNETSFGAGGNITNYPFWLTRRGGSFSSVEMVSQRSFTYYGTGTWCTTYPYTSRSTTVGFRGAVSANQF